MSLFCSPNFQFTFSYFDKVTYVTGSNRLTPQRTEYKHFVKDSAFKFLQDRKCLRNSLGGANPFSAIRLLGYVQGRMWGTLHFSLQKFFNLRKVISCFSIAHCIRRSLDRRCFMLLGSPVKLIIVLCTRNGEREEILSSSFSACMKRNLGTYVFFG